MYEQNNCAVSYGYKTADRRYEYSWSSHWFSAYWRKAESFVWKWRVCLSWYTLLWWNQEISVGDTSTCPSWSDCKERWHNSSGKYRWKRRWSSLCYHGSADPSRVETDGEKGCNGCRRREAWSSDRKPPDWAGWNIRRKGKRGCKSKCNQSSETILWHGGRGFPLRRAWNCSGRKGPRLWIGSQYGTGFRTRWSRVCIHIPLCNARCGRSRAHSMLYSCR